MAGSFRDQLFPPELREIYDFWYACRGGDRIPAFSELDLMAIPKLAPNCFVMDVVGGRRYRYRFVGTAIDQHIGVPLTGRLMDEVRHGRLLETLTDYFARVEESRRPGYVMTHMPTETRSHMVYHRIALPLSDDGETVDKIFGAHFFKPSEDRPAARPYVEGADADEYGRAVMIFEEDD